MVPVIGDELRVEVPVRVRVAGEQLAPDLERGGRDVDGDGTASEAVQQMGQPAGAGPELGHDLTGTETQPVGEHADVEQTTGELGAVAERLAEQVRAVLVVGEVAFGRLVERLGPGRELFGGKAMPGRRHLHLVGQEEPLDDHVGEELHPIGPGRQPPGDPDDDRREPFSLAHGSRWVGSQGRR